MSLFRTSLRPPAILSDEAIERYLTAVRAELDPDPLFRRRLRGHLLNRFVAIREGVAAGRPAKEMGRLGRAVLYASFGLAVSVTGAMAASQQSIPGDVLYPLKRDIEALRLRVLPDRFHDDLAAYALGQRIDELGRLAEQGNWAAVAAQAQAVDAAYERLLAEGGTPEALAESLAVVEAIFERLPEAARDAVERAHGDAPGLGDRPASGQGREPRSAQGHGSGSGQGQGSNSGGTSSGASAAPPGPTAQPSPTPRASDASSAPATPRQQPRATVAPKSDTSTATPSPSPSDDEDQGEDQDEDEDTNR